MLEKLGRAIHHQSIQFCWRFGNSEIHLLLQKRSWGFFIWSWWSRQRWINVFDCLLVLLWLEILHVPDSQWRKLIQNLIGKLFFSACQLVWVVWVFGAVAYLWFGESVMGYLFWKAIKFEVLWHFSSCFLLYQVQSCPSYFKVLLAGIVWKIFVLSSFQFVIIGLMDQKLS